MPSIESIGYALVFKVDTRRNVPTEIAKTSDGSSIRVAVRALEGMQKEALVQNGNTGTLWRMVSDEGPYLNGTDLAPFPLAFYTTGMALSFVEEIERHAIARGVELHDLKLTQDNYYTMEGSAIRGDMMGGAIPAELVVDIKTNAPEAVVHEIVAAAENTSPAQAYNRDKHENAFALSLNGRQIPVKRVQASPKALLDDPVAYFDTLQPLPADAYAPDIIVKQKTAETVFNVEGGAGSSLQSEQKRTLHVRGIVTRRDDGLHEVSVQLFKPIGSLFRFIGDSSAQERAPSALAYLSAGIGFCFMTQLGRYAHIVKKPLESYRIVQDNLYYHREGTAKNAPVDTHVYIRFGYTEEGAQQMLHMSEQTCFLHAAMRSSVPSKVMIRTEALEHSLPMRAD